MASSSTAENDVEVRTVHADKRLLEPGGDDDVVCSSDVCDELDECNVYANDCEGDFENEVTGVTLLRDDVAKARMEQMAWCEKLEAYEGDRRNVYDEHKT